MNEALKDGGFVLMGKDSVSYIKKGEKIKHVLLDQNGEKKQYYYAGAYLTVNLKDGSIKNDDIVLFERLADMETLLRLSNFLAENNLQWDEEKKTLVKVEKKEEPKKLRLEKKDAVVKTMTCDLPNWKRVYSHCMRTVGKDNVRREPSNKFKRSMLLAEHSPIRMLVYDFTIEDIRQWVTTHLVRHHVGCEKFVATQRTDRNEDLCCHDRDDLPQGLLNDMDMTCNAQAFINISRKRLCNNASPETRSVWKMVIDKLSHVDPILAEKCVPECLYRGFCPEMKKCGYADTNKYQEDLIRYRKTED